MRQPIYSLNSEGRVSRTIAWQILKIHTLRHSIAVPGWCWKAIFAHIIKRLGLCHAFVPFFFNKFPSVTHVRRVRSPNNQFTARSSVTRAAQMNVRTERARNLPPLTNRSSEIACQSRIAAQSANRWLLNGPRPIGTQQVCSFQLNFLHGLSFLFLSPRWKEKESRWMSAESSSEKNRLWRFDCTSWAVRFETHQEG